ncbi:bifunctional helix-turn-helix transcriptional regulator/GNAT family N-acetyltransferase [Nocardioides sp. KC13]|uniref:Bifunctional helix-turn-helix transcriptional regulator/GNAT family N-acetyltransferase n=1 Tax=Nocardioides turkmenicus TaxID=2711220 RepID=A0A6M1QTE4_9ACTN|nr:bifunctional helix-turn-helix transcriptional regulator/GNAT family N-acetyltransferase [Nocardioides sp. KC13]NGN93133.1 bifunctional helix-turn-helix transcriptional regulator/GNAT family N-acetyltransferase [Nocardioides sp. KC13]
MTVDTSVMRKFNMSYVRRVGALEESFLGSGLPYGTARILYEIGLGAETVQDLRTRLGGLDSGYVSRMLRSLESKGFVATERDPADGRRRLVVLTEDGLKQWDDLERRSEERAHLLLDPLTQRQRDRLNEALATADLLVRAATITIEPVDPRDPMAQEAMGHYFAEIGERFGFTVGDEGFGDDPSLRPPHGTFFVAASDGAPVASGGVREFPSTSSGHRDERTAEIKRMWVDPAWRGAGLGSRLLRHLEAEALRLGHQVVRLDTRDVLTEAIGMYERAGYERIDRYNDNPHATHFFRKQLR